MLTKLEAVNQILDGIGESPVDSLDSGLPDAEEAVRILDRTTQRILEKGWHCNTVYKLKLQPGGDKKIPMPENALRIDATYVSRGMSITVRKDADDIFKLYDITKQTFEFKASVFVDVIYNFPFESLTEALRQYIAAEAAVTYQRRKMGSSALNASLREERDAAYAGLIDAEAEVDNFNPLVDNAYLAFVSGRNSNIRGA